MTKLPSIPATFFRTWWHAGLLLLGMLVMPWAAQAQSSTLPAVRTAEQPAPTAEQSDAVVDHAPVVVSGLQPGPGLWRVSKGDHVLWVMGTLSPLPRDIEWDTNALEKAVARSQQVLWSPSLQVDADVGLLGRLTLLPSALKARRNPDGQRLQDVLSPDEYARWQVLKARYIGRDGGIERWRPAFAALALYEKAIERSGMTERGIVQTAVRNSAETWKVPIVEVEVRIPVAEPRRVLREFSQTALDDGDCFRRTLERIEGDLGNMIERGNAWAWGDIDQLRALPYRNQYVVCMGAFTQSGLAQRLGMHDVRTRLEQAWLASARQALERNASTVALLPISQLLQADGYLSRLQAEGYEVQAP